MMKYEAEEQKSSCILLLVYVHFHNRRLHTSCDKVQFAYVTHNIFKKVSQNFDFPIITMLSIAFKIHHYF